MDFSRRLRLKSAHDHVLAAFLSPACLVEHAIRLPYSGGVAQKNFEAATRAAWLLPGGKDWIEISHGGDDCMLRTHSDVPVLEEANGLSRTLPFIDCHVAHT